jgi:signal transduction histidine kinase
MLSKARGTPARDGGESFVFESTEPGKIVRLQLSGGLPILDGERVVGRSFPLPPVGDASIDGESQTFVARLSRSMLVAAALLLVVATLAAWAISTRILGPIAALRAAAERIGSGDFTGRVGKVRMRELRPLAESFDGMAAGLSRSEGLRRQFVRDIAHELRSPLTNLQGQIEALQDRLTEPTTDALSSLHEETMLLQRLVADLDALARADAGELALRRERVAVVDELRRIVDGFVRAGRAREGALEVAGAASVFVHVDRERFGQMVRNVIENALTHGAGPGIIQLRAVKGAEFVDVIVQDNGSGIPAEHANRVWERLYRPDDARTRAHGGSGLGLAIVKSLVEAHGGRVSLKSEPGKGTLVTLSFPAVPDNEMRPAGLSDGQ